MIRLYFLTPTIESMRSIVSECKEMGVLDRHIHVVGKNHDAIQMAHLPEATLLESSDFIPAVERGMALGGGAGLLAGIIGVTFPPAGLVLGGGAVLGLSLFGAGFGAWVSGMIGVSVPNSHLRRFEEALKNGEFLLLLDVSKEDEDKFRDMILKHHPEAHIEGTEPKLPPAL